MESDRGSDGNPEQGADGPGADEQGADGPGAVEYGPRGYLPERAAKRARKIVLREQMGLHWVIAAILAALLILVAGGVYLLGGAGASDPSPPGRPGEMRTSAVESLPDADLPIW